MAATTLELYEPGDHRPAGILRLQMFGVGFHPIPSDAITWGNVDV